MTSFGKISPIWQNLTSLWQFFNSLFLFFKMMGLLWQIWNILWIIFIVANGQILKNNLTIWSHCFLSEPQSFALLQHSHYFPIFYDSLLWPFWQIKTFHDSNSRSLVSAANALPPEPQPPPLMHILKNGPIPASVFFIFVFSIQLILNVQYKFLPMTGFELRTSAVRGECSTTWATTTTLNAHSWNSKILINFFGKNKILNLNPLSY